MPLELVAVAPRTPRLRSYKERRLKPREIRIRTEFASPKHGTELVAYRNEPAANRLYRPRVGAVVPRTVEEGRKTFPRRLGNMAVGVVVEVGPAVTRFRVGDRVYGHFPIRETQVCDEAAADPLPDRLSAESAVCLDPAVMALAMRDAGPQLGDHVAVFGLGAIGLMCVQLALLGGAQTVLAVDLLVNRRTLALGYGVAEALDPSESGDVGMEIRRLVGPSPAPAAWARGPRVRGGYREDPTQVGERGVDLAVETSGSTRALHDAIRATRFGGTVCVISYYGGEAVGLYLGDEFHVNRLTLVSCRSQSLPMRDHPAWTLRRYSELCETWLGEGRLRTDGMVSPVVPFSDVVEAYTEIDEHPERSIKLGVVFPASGRS